MATIDYWKVIHQYMSLVESSRAQPLCCPECDERLKLRLGKEESPMLQCSHCDTKYYLGSDIWGQIRAVVSEWHLEGE